MRAYPETVVVLQPKAQRQRARASQAMELGTILSAIEPSRRRTAQRFLDYLAALGLAFKTRKGYADVIRSLERIDKPYLDITREDLISWIRDLELEIGLRPSSINLYKALAKRYFRWLYNPDEDSEEYPEVVRWIKTRPPKPSDDRYIPSRHEILRMVQAAECQRDRALQFVLLESGARAGEFIKMRIKDVAFDRYGALVRVSGKTGERRIRLVESVPDLQLWLSMHPRREDPDAPLWTARTEPYQAIGKNGLDVVIRKYCRVLRTGSSFGAHKFRHAQATEDAKHYPEPVLRAKYGWTKSSDMPSVYVHHSARDTDGVILAHYGIETGADPAALKPSLPKDCPRCKHSNSAMAKFCMQCSAPLDAEAVMEIESKTAQADEITAQVLSELMKRAPEMLEKVLNETGLQSKIVSVVNG